MRDGTEDERDHVMLKLGLVYLVSFAIAATASSCDAVDRAYDCNQICNRYKECADADYDASACASECRDNAADSEDFEDQADDCQACIDDRSCVGAAFNCGSECAAIVP